MVDKANKIEASPEAGAKWSQATKIGQRSPEQNVGEFYDAVGGDGYDEFVQDINFNEPTEFMKMVGAG